MQFNQVDYSLNGHPPSLSRLVWQKNNMKNPALSLASSELNTNNISMNLCADVTKDNYLSSDAALTVSKENILSEPTNRALSSSSSNGGSNNSSSSNISSRSDNARKRSRKSITKIQVAPLPSSVDLYSSPGKDEVNVSESDSGEDHKKSPLYQAFTPLLRSLTILGLHYDRAVSKDGRSSSCSVPSALQVYCWIVTLVSWALFVRACTVMKYVSGLGPVMLSSIVTAVYFLLQAINATSFLKASHNTCGIRKFFRGFMKLDKYGGSYLCPIKTRKYIRFGTIFTWFLVIVDQAILGYVILATSFFDLFTNDPFPPSEVTKILIMKITFYVLMFWTVAEWMFPSPFQLSIAIIIYKEFRLFCKSLKQKTSKNGEFRGSLEQERRRYIQMVRIVEAADKCLSTHQTASFVCNLAIICFMVYIILYYTSFVALPVVMGGFIFWMVYCVADIAIVIISGVLINSAAGEVADRLHLINLTNVSTDFTAQMMAFLNRTGVSVGLTVSKLFVIDQTVILSLLTAFVTYFLIVIQFASSASCNCTCNCTGSTYTY